jgi:ketosteroid isomerase-like protein
LYERYADMLPEGPERERAAATARSVATVLGPIDDNFWTGAIPPTIEVVDHRILGTFSGHGAEALLQKLRPWLELGADLAISAADVLALQSGALLTRITFSGTDRASGGAFERQLIQLLVFGSDGLLTRLEQFDSDRDAEALARFDELVPSPSLALGTSSAESLVPVSPAVRIENAVTRLNDQFATAWAARDWARIGALFAPDFRLIDRRRYAHLELDRNQHLESLRFRFEMRSSRTTLEVIATRGRRLALMRQRFELAGGDVGPSETESLNVAESGAHGNFVVLVTFDPDDLDAAYGELDDRYVAGEAAPFSAVTAGARAFAAAIAARDWDALAAVLAPDVVIDDHRPLGWGTLRGSATLVDTWKSLVDLAPDVRARIDHCTVSANGSLAALTLLGSHQGGAFEDVRVVVHEYDEKGKIRRHDIYTLEQLEQAQARFEELCSEAAA